MTDPALDAWVARMIAAGGRPAAPTLPLTPSSSADGLGFPADMERRILKLEERAGRRGETLKETADELGWLRQDILMLRSVAQSTFDMTPTTGGRPPRCLGVPCGAVRTGTNYQITDDNFNDGGVDIGPFPLPYLPGTAPTLYLEAGPPARHAVAENPGEGYWDSGQYTIAPFGGFGDYLGRILMACYSIFEDGNPNPVGGGFLVVQYGTFSVLGDLGDHIFTDTTAGANNYGIPAVVSCSPLEFLAPWYGGIPHRRAVITEAP